MKIRCRRRFFTISVFVAMLTALVAGTLHMSPGHAAEAVIGNMDAMAARPNVIIMLADDLGIGDVSCYGATAIATSNIDRIARNGIRFTKGYATSATCTPSRFALMTGVWPIRPSSATSACESG